MRRRVAQFGFIRDKVVGNLPPAGKGRSPLHPGTVEVEARLNVSATWPRRRHYSRCAAGLTER